LSQAVEEPWTVEQFFDWQALQPDRYEPVGGYPVRIMAGARNAHGAVVVNVIAELRDKLRGKPCRPFSGDSAVETLPGQIRRPDAGVDCGPREPNGLKATAPSLVVEVLAPNTRDFDAFDKCEEYKTVASITYILLIEPNAPEVVMWSRRADKTWARQSFVGLEAELDMATLGISLATADIYADVDFPAGPRLVQGG
jgi:Uma2 family endonuclease